MIKSAGLTPPQLLGLALLVLCGCARFEVTQIDESIDERIITTRIKGTAWFSSAQNIAKIKATQTDKSQTVGADAIGQHGSTNVAATLDALTRLIGAMRP